MNAEITFIILEGLDTKNYWLILLEVAWNKPMV